MRLGPLEVRFAAPRVPTGEQGYSGAPSSDGSAIFGPETDYSTIWSNLSTRWTTVQKMLTDADVSAALDAVLLPVLAAGLTIEPGENTPAGREAAAFLQNDLENMSLSLADFRMAALLGALSDGVSIWEKVWQNGDDGKIHLRKLGERPPRTVTHDGWLLDGHGGPRGIKQLDTLGTEIELPIDRLILFIHRRRQGSLVGESLLRRVYGHWKIKSDLMRIGAVGVARHIGGIPTMRPASKDVTYLDRVDTLLAGLATYEHQFVRLDADQSIDDFEVKGVKGELADPIPQLEYHRRGIYLGLLCPFLPLGSDGVGSMALSETQSSFFLMLLRTIAKLEEDTINRYLIQQWCSYNWTIDEGALPKAKVGRLDRRDVSAWFEAVVKAVESGAVMVGEELRTQAEELLGIERPDAAETGQTSGEDASDQDTPPATPPTVVAGSAHMATGAPATRPTPPDLPSVTAIRALGIDVRFDRIAAGMDAAEERIVKRLTELQRSQAKRLLSVGRKAIRDRDTELLEATAVESDREAAELEAAMLAVFGDARTEYEHELASQGVDVTAPDDDDNGARRLILVAWAAEAARRLSDRMRTAWGGEVARQMLPEVGYSADALAAMVTAAPEKLLVDLARQAVSISAGTGRALVSEANAEAIQEEIYTTALDQRVCGQCRPHEGKTYKVGDGPPTPNPMCEGGSRCRCLRIPVAKRG